MATTESEVLPYPTNWPEARAVLRAVPDGWAKVNGVWVRLEDGQTENDALRAENKALKEEVRRLVSKCERLLPGGSR